MIVTDIITDFAHVYQSGSADPELLKNSAVSRGKPVLLHKHSSILTCRGFDHAIIIPTSAASATDGEGRDVPPDGAVQLQALPGL